MLEILVVKTVFSTTFKVLFSVPKLLTLGLMEFVNYLYCTRIDPCTEISVQRAHVPCCVIFTFT